MAFFTLDDFSGSCECLTFAKTYEKYGQLIEEENCVIIVGRPESSGDAIKLHIEEIIPIEQVKEKIMTLRKYIKKLEEKSKETLKRRKSFTEVPK